VSCTFAAAAHSPFRRHPDGAKRISRLRVANERRPTNGAHARQPIVTPSTGKWIHLTNFASAQWATPDHWNGGVWCWRNGSASDLRSGGRELELRPGRGCVRRLWASCSHPCASTLTVSVTIGGRRTYTSDQFICIAARSADALAALF